MTKLLEKAFNEASKLPQSDQDSLAQFLLAELESERRWNQVFAESQTELALLADEALGEFREGKTKDLLSDRDLADD